MDCKSCKWKQVETCRVCQQDQKAKKPDTSHYGIYYLTKISKN